MNVRPSLILLLLGLAMMNLYAQLPKGTLQNKNFSITYDSSSSERKPMLVFNEPEKLDTASGERRLIIRLKGAPLALAEGNENARIKSITDEHAGFINDFNRITRTTAARSTVPSVILQEYKTTFNGFAVITSPEVEAKLKLLPYVSTVTEDKKVEAIVEHGTKIIGADKVWSDFNITGRGVVIGIIDTGIDYTHPDLGAGIGADKKVIGGYDFVNEDNDPFDDHGHGTHVAGIAAANGTIKGVAPDAKLMAFKVLNNYGIGWDSWILAGIERTVDPDQNPATNDACHVVNISLGRFADPDEPFSEAIANATRMGVTFVVAAGNSWDYQTIGTPAQAADAITVAATDHQDVTAYFSSKGPTNDSFRLKPDVAAPGVDIKSALPGGQYAHFSGTSMASPFVAGAAALLLEKNPSWTPAMLKAALMNNSKRPEESLYHQGAGRIDVEKSIKAGFMVLPGSISLGLISQNDITTKEAKVTVSNTSTLPGNYSVSFSGGIVHNAITVSANPATVSLLPGESAEVIITFIVDPAQLQPIYYANGYFGDVVVQNGSELIKTPVAMIHSNSTKISFSEPIPYYVFVTGVESYYGKQHIVTSKETIIFLPDGMFDLTAIYDSKIVFSEAVIGSVNTILNMHDSLANNEIVFQPVDKEGNPIDFNVLEKLGLGTLHLRDSWIGIFFYPLKKVVISDNSIARFEMQFRDYWNETFYDIAISSDKGQHGNTTHSNKDWTRLQINAPTSEEYGMHYVSNLYWWNIYNTVPYSFNDSFVIMSSKRSPKERDFIYSKSTIVPSNAGNPTWETSYFSARSDGFLELTNSAKWLNEPIALIKTDDYSFNLGNTLVRWSGIMYNYNETATLFDFPYIGLFNYRNGERKRGNISYEIWNDNVQLDQGTILNRTVLDYLWSFYLLGPTSGLNNKLVLKWGNHNVQGKDGNIKVELNYQLSEGDPSPPILRFFDLQQQLVSTDLINFGEQAEFKIVGADCDYMYTGCINRVDEIKLSVRVGTDWLPVQLAGSVQDTVRGVVPDFLGEGHYDLQLFVKDAAGNSFTYTLEPGFKVGPAINPYGKVNLLAPANSSLVAALTPEFQWNPLSGAVSYTFQLSKSIAFSSIEKEIVVSSTSLISDALTSNTTYFWRVRATMASGTSLWSDVFTFSTPAELILIAPANNSDGHSPESILFQWSAIPNVSNYVVEFSLAPNFPTLVKLVPVTTNSVSIPEFMQGTVYYWRVNAIIPPTTQVRSQVFSFRTGIITDVESGVEDFQPSVFPNPAGDKCTLVFFTDRMVPVHFMLSDAQGKSHLEASMQPENTGRNELSINTASLSSGVYIGRLKSGERVYNLKIIIYR